MSAILSLRDYTRDVICHSHDHVQLLFGLQGTLDLEISGHAGSLRCLPRQTLAIVPATTQHACDSRTGSRCLVLDVPEHWVRSRLAGRTDSSLRLFERPLIQDMTVSQYQLVDWLARHAATDRALGEHGAALLIASLAQGCAPAEASAFPLAALRAHIDRHLQHPLQVADLARLCGLSVARLHARFLAETGRSPMAYVRERRLARARALLQSTDLPIGEVAARVGYDSQSAFAAAVRQAYGKSPRRLRREPLDKTGE